MLFFRMQVYCCLSSGMEILTCSKTKPYTDNDTSLTIEKPTYKWDTINARQTYTTQIIRDVGWNYVGE